MGSAHSTPPHTHTPSHTRQPPDSETGRGRGARLSPFAPAPAPSASYPGWVGEAGNQYQSSKHEFSATTGGREGDPQPGAGRGMVEGGGRAFGAAAAARAESQAPLCGQGVLPLFSDDLPFSSPVP